MNSENLFYSEDALLQFSTDLLKSAGMGKNEAQVVASVLIWANCRGIDSHGVTRLPIYLAEIKRGEFVIDGKPKIHHLLPATFKMDCARTAGPACMMAAASQCNSIGSNLWSGPGPFECTDTPRRYRTSYQLDR